MGNENNSNRQDDRVFVRLPIAVPATFRSENGYSGTASLEDVSRGGMSLRTGQYVRPGRLVMLSLTAPDTGAAIELKARVTWCRPVESGRTFRIGVHVINDAAESAENLSRLVYAAALSMPLVRPESSWNASHTVLAPGFLRQDILAASFSVMLGALTAHVNGLV